MQKAFRRLKLLNEVYGGKEISNGDIGGKLKEMGAYYEVDNPELMQSRPDCVNHLHVYPENIAGTLASVQNVAAACVIQSKFCVDLIPLAAQLQELNEKLRVDCITLY